MRTLLLTGAGFTHDFGGYLARNMWEKIFNHNEIKQHPKLNRLIISDFDYESVYYKVHSDPQYCHEEAKAIDMAILDAYISR